MLHITEELIAQIRDHGARYYPEEGAGLILGKYDGGERTAERIIQLKNSSQPDSRHNRYIIEAKDVLAGEDHAEKLGLDVIGVFHSHPDHPAQPSDFDLEWALPNFSYTITSVCAGKAVSSRSWCISDDGGFIEEGLFIVNDNNPEVSP
jgi:proteasome lid subunit RPN8/RPN11